MAQTKDGAMKTAAKKAGLSFDEYKSMLASGLKRCTKCKAWKQQDAFGNDKTRGDGKDSTCLECRHVDDPYASLRGRVSTFKGRSHTPEAKLRMSAAKKGKKFRLGKKHSTETRAKISKITRERTPRGVDAPGYIDGKGVERRGLRFSEQYK